MATTIALRSAYGLTYWEKAVGGGQTTRPGEIALAIAVEAAIEQLESASGCRNGRRR